MWMLRIIPFTVEAAHEKSPKLETKEHDIVEMLNKR